MKSFNDMTAKDIKAGQTVDTAEGWMISRAKYSGDWVAQRGSKLFTQPSYAALVRTLSIVN